MPVTFQPRRRPERVTARMTAFRPGASPPPVLTRTCMLSNAITWAARSCNNYRRETFAKSRIALMRAKQMTLWRSRGRGLRRQRLRVGERRGLRDRAAVAGAGRAALAGDAGGTGAAAAATAA